MEEAILLKAINLSNELKSDERVKKLNQLEAKLNNNDEAKVLSYQMDVASMHYSDALKIYAKDSEEIKPYIKALSSAKEKLNSLPIVKEYNQAYLEVKKLYNEINQIVFDDLNKALDVNK